MIAAAAPFPVRVRVIENFCENVQPASTKTGSIFVGRLVAEKGILQLIKSWPGSEILSIVGEGPLASEIEQHSHSKKNIVFLGSLPHTRVREMIAKSQTLVIPSTWAEGLPTVYMEAVTSGTSVVARSGSAAADAVERDHTGATYVTTKQLERALMLSNTGQLVTNTKAKDLYSTRRWLSAITDLYREAIAR